MKLFQPIEIEIKTGWTKEELVNRLSSKANFVNNEFTMYSDFLPYGLWSYAKGSVGSLDEWTLLSFRIYPSFLLLAFSTICFVFCGLALIYYITTSIINWQYNNGIVMALIFWIAVFIVTQLSYKTSADQREESIRQMIRQ